MRLEIAEINEISLMSIFVNFCNSVLYGILAHPHRVGDFLLSVAAHPHEVAYFVLGFAKVPGGVDLRLEIAENRRIRHLSIFSIFRSFHFDNAQIRYAHAGAEATK